MIPLPPFKVVKGGIVFAIAYGLADYIVSFFPLQIWATTISLPPTFISTALSALALYFLFWYLGLG